MRSLNLHLDDIGPRARAERHRARTIGLQRWFAELHDALTVCLHGLPQDVLAATVAEIREAGSELDTIICDGYAERRVPAEVGAEVYLVVTARMRAAAATQTPDFIDFTEVR